MGSTAAPRPILAARAVDALSASASSLDACFRVHSSSRNQLMWERNHPIWPKWLMPLAQSVHLSQDLPCRAQSLDGGAPEATREGQSALTSGEKSCNTLARCDRCCRLLGRSRGCRCGCLCGCRCGCRCHVWLSLMLLLANIARCNNCTRSVVECALAAVTARLHYPGTCLVSRCGKRVQHCRLGVKLGT